MKGTPLFRVLAFATVASAFLFSTRPALATNEHGFTVASIDDTVRVNSDGSLDTKRIVELTVTNNSTDNYTDKIKDFTLDSVSITYLDGNPHDVVTGVTFDDDTLNYDNNHGANNCYKGDVLNPGDFCDVAVKLQFTGVAPVPHGLNGSNLSYGEDSIEISVNADATRAEVGVETPALDPPVSGDVTFDVRVKYDGPDATPEPGSFILLGTGMLGLAGMVRRKLGRG
jgi:hypothetical protein